MISWKPRSPFAITLLEPAFAFLAAAARLFGQQGRLSLLGLQLGMLVGKPGNFRFGKSLLQQPRRFRAVLLRAGLTIFTEEGDCLVIWIETQGSAPNDRNLQFTFLSSMLRQLVPGPY